MNKPSVSIIIPTRNSEKVIPMCLQAAVHQNYPKRKFEVIVVDNYSQDKTLSIIKSFKVKYYLVAGKPSQGCLQRNLGAKKSTGEYLLFLDHDMQMSLNLLNNFTDKVKETDNSVDAWYIPERVIANNTFLSNVRSFEKNCYNGTVINAARIIKKNKFKETDGYDMKLSNGPADWDMDIQLRKIGSKFGIIDEYISHHEEHLSFWKYVTKKKLWVKGIELYKSKWYRQDRVMYNDIIKKQFGLYYRLLGVFIEDKKWRKLLVNFHLYLTLVFIKILFGIFYLSGRSK